MNGWTKDDVARIAANSAVRKNRTVVVANRSIGCILGSRAIAKGNRGTFHNSGQMNKTEAAYAARLESLKLAGEIADYRFECIKLRLADNTFYAPDFMVLRPDGAFEVHEVKGHWEDDARVKIKVAAELYPFKFIAARKVKGAWLFEEF